jgi:hypothetical protein
MNLSIALLALAQVAALSKSDIVKSPKEPVTSRRASRAAASRTTSS